MASLQQDRPPLCNARDLISGSKSFWSVLIQVLRKDDIKMGRNEKRYQSYILTDMEGTVIGAVSFDPTLNKFNRLLEPYRRYYVSNAWVKPAKPEYQISDYSQSWTLTNQTHVEHIDDEVPYPIPCNFNFVRFSDLPKWIDHPEPIALRCLIVHAVPDHQTYNSPTKHKYVVIDEDAIAMMITAREDLVDNTQSQLTLRFPEPSTFVFINVRVSTRYGLSLTTQVASSAFYDPPLSEQSSLTEWYQKNTQLVATLLQQEAYRNTDTLMPFPEPDQIMPIVEALKVLDKVRVAWVSGNMYLMPAQENFWYPACPSCYKKMNPHITWETDCNSCRAKGTAIPRCRVEFFLNDSTETMSITYFGEQAEELIGHTAVELKAAPEKHREIEKELETVLYKKAVTCFVKCFDKTFQGSNIRTHTVIKMYPTTKNSDTSAGMSSEAAASEAKNTTHDKAPSEFFTPTTKLVLEEISSHTATGESSSIIPTSTKRSLFQPTAPRITTDSQAHPTLQSASDKSTTDVDISQSEVLPQVNESTTETDGDTIIAVSTLESPVKRTKNKEKECWIIRLFHLPTKSNSFSTTTTTII